MGGLGVAALAVIAGVPMFEDNWRIEVFPFDGNSVDGWHIVVIRLFQNGCG